MVMRGTVTLVAMVGSMALAACDTQGTELDRGTTTDPVALDPIEGIDTPAFVPIVDVPAEVLGDNESCALADTLAAGTVHATMDGHTKTSACFADGMTSIGRYWRVHVPAHESAAITLRTARGESQGYLWLTAAPGCDVRPVSEDWSECRGDWSWQHDGIVVTNPDDTDRDMVVAAVADERMRGVAIDVTLTRDVLASNATCADALAVMGDRVTNQKTSQAGLAIDGAPVWRMLYYTVVVPPLARLSATIDFGDSPPGDVYPYFLSSCDPSANVWSSLGEVTNPGDQPMTALLGVGTNYTVSSAPFAIDIRSTTISPRAACDNAAPLAVGDTTELDLEAGGAGPALCWCISPQRSLYVDVEVPAGATVELVGAVAGGDAVGRVDLIELEDQCASECGSNAVFGFDGETVLPLENTSDTAVVKHVLVAGSPGWELTTNVAPRASLSVRAQGTE